MNDAQFRAHGYVPPTQERVRIERFSSYITATLGYEFVILDAETGEMVTSNVPVGSPMWRRLARLARNYKVAKP